MAAIFEQMLRMRLLKVAASNLVTRNLRRNSKYRHTIPMTIEETIDKVKIARAATARAHSDRTCKVSLRTGSKSSHLLMPYMYPLDLFTFPDYVGQAIQRIT